MNCYIYRNGLQSGPLELEAIRASVAQGSVHLDDFARTDAMTGWISVEQLLHVPAAVPPAAPPEPAPSPEAAVAAAAAVPAPALLPAMLPHSEPEPAGNPITWPFHQRKWALSLWMPCLWWVSPPVFSLGLFLALGWGLEAIRRRARRDPDRLPDPRNLASMLKDGLVVMLLLLPYFVIPLAIIAKLSAWEGLKQAGELVGWIWTTVLGRPHQPFWEFLARQAAMLLTHMAAPGAYLALAVPLFLAAWLRYALTGHIRVFFALFHNLAVCLRHLGGFLKLLFLSFLAGATIKIAALMLVSTGIGIPAGILLVAAEFWIIAYWAGDLAAEIDVPRPDRH